MWKEVMGSRKRQLVRVFRSVLRIMVGERLHTVIARSSQPEFTYNSRRMNDYDQLIVRAWHLRYHPLHIVPKLFPERALWWNRSLLAWT
jgi:hypothetical protein